MSLPRLPVALTATLFFAFGTGCASLEAGMQEMGIDLDTILAAGAPLDSPTVASGLRQALEVGTERTTASLSREGGFGDDPTLRLGLPGELGQLASMMRSVGFGAQVDQLEDAMNRAAERAAAEAVPVFATAIQAMTIEDAFEILKGEPDAATRYFQSKTTDTLRGRFQPVVAKAMEEVGLYGIYRDLVARYERIPLTKPPALDLEGFVADQTLEALFTNLAAEEARIREDPAARSTALLRRVFGEPASPDTSGSGSRGAPSGYGRPR